MVDQKTSVYDPAAKFDVEVSDVEYRRGDGESWLARIYLPKTGGPFPAILDVHGGAWSGGSRTSAELFDMALASTGIVVAAVDFRVAPEHPYPAQVQDVNYATRWLKASASRFNALPQNIGGLGSSSGGHTVMLSAMRPHDERYASITSAEVAGHDASLDYILATWPVLDPYARYQYAKRVGRENLIANTEGYFLTEEAMQEGNPQLILERGETVELPPTLIIQGTADDNVPMSIPHGFVASYSAAGGHVELEEFPGMHHGFGREQSEATDRAIEFMKTFIAKQLSAKAARV